MKANVRLKRTFRSEDRRGAVTPAGVADRVAPILSGYAERGVFHGYSRGLTNAGRTSFKILWHYNRMYELVLDETARTATFPVLLPGVPARSEMYRSLKAYIRSFHSNSVPEHRRVDESKASIYSKSRAGIVSLTLAVPNDDYEYGIRKLINLSHEIFLSFIIQGLYYDYRVQRLGLDPDAAGGFF